MRLFIGIPLAAAVIDELKAATSRLHSSADGLRWTAPESWHITLQFLGNTDPEQYTCLVPRLRALHSPPVSISLEALGCFDRAGILFAGVRLTPELLLLQERVTTATQPCGFAPESRPYQPHITLARAKGQRAVWANSKQKSAAYRTSPGSSPTNSFFTKAFSRLPAHVTKSANVFRLAGARIRPALSVRFLSEPAPAPICYAQMLRNSTLKSPAPKRPEDHRIHA
jgi:2'-5' RNA ligase